MATIPGAVIFFSKFKKIFFWDTLILSMRILVNKINSCRGDLSFILDETATLFQGDAPRQTELC